MGGTAGRIVDETTRVVNRATGGRTGHTELEKEDWIGASQRGAQHAAMELGKAGDHNKDQLFGAIDKFGRGVHEGIQFITGQGGGGDEVQTKTDTSVNYSNTSASQGKTGVQKTKGAKIESDSDKRGAMKIGKKELKKQGPSKKRVIG